jgi:hypothetical protein
MSWLWQNADKVASLAQVLLVAIGIGALLIAYLQVRSTRLAQQEATAKSLYLEYLRLAVEYPKLAAPDSRDHQLIGDNRYRWFVAFLLNCCDEIISSLERSDEWEDVIRSDLKNHSAYLQSDYFLVEDGGWCLYSRRLKNLATRCRRSKEKMDA